MSIVLSGTTKHSTKKGTEINGAEYQSITTRDDADYHMLWIFVTHGIKICSALNDVYFLRNKTRRNILYLLDRIYNKDYIILRHIYIYI